jgi:hypothetical protein
LFFIFTNFPSCGMVYLNFQAPLYVVILLSL